MVYVKRTSPLLRPARLMLALATAFAGGSGMVHAESVVTRIPLEDWSGAYQSYRTVCCGTHRTTDEMLAAIKDWSAKFPTDNSQWLAGRGSTPLDANNEPLPWTSDIPPQLRQTPPVQTASTKGWVHGFRLRQHAMMRDAAYLARIFSDPETNVPYLPHPNAVFSSYTQCTPGTNCPADFARLKTWVVTQLDYYAQNRSNWAAQPVRVGRGLLMENTMTEADQLLTLVETARLMKPFVTKEKYEDWQARFFMPEAEMLMNDYFLMKAGDPKSFNNITVWQLSAVLAVAALYKDPSLWERALNGEPTGLKKGLRYILENGVMTFATSNGTSAGMWIEGSIGYNNYVVIALSRMLAQVSMMGRLAEVKDVAAKVGAMRLAPLLLRFPDDKVPSPGDGANTTAPDIVTFTRSYRVLPTVWGEYAYHTFPEVFLVSSLVDPVARPADWPATPVLPDVTSANLQTAQMAMLKDNAGWQVFIHYGQLTGNHAHQEALNYEAYFGNTPITHDLGTSNVGAINGALYAYSAAAHNIPLLNTLGQSDGVTGVDVYPANPYSRPGQLLNFDDGSRSGLPQLEALQPAYQPGVSASRKLVINGNTLTDTVTVNIDPVTWTKLPPNSRLGLPLHLQCTIAPTQSQVSFTPVTNADAGFTRNQLQNWKNPARWTVPAKVSTVQVALTCGTSAPRPFTYTITFPNTGGAYLYRATVPDTTRLRDMLYLELPAAQSTVFTTTLTAL